jgi:phage shock protein A
MANSQTVPADTIDISEAKKEYQKIIGQRIKDMLQTLNNLENMADTNEMMRQNVSYLKTYIENFKADTAFFQSADNTIKIKLETIQQRIESLSAQLRESEQKAILAQSGNVDNTLKAVEGLLNLNSQLLHFKTRCEELHKDSINSRYTIDSLDRRITTLDDKISIVDKLTKKGPWNIGLALGFSFDCFNDDKYVTHNDTLARESSHWGIGSAMISGVISYKIRKTPWRAIINIEMVDVSVSEGDVSHLFNKKIPLGLGLGYEIDNIENSNKGLSAFIIVNADTKKRLDMELYQDHKFHDYYMKTIDLDKFVTKSRMVISIYMGVFYTF